jgi:diguanylate cyclase (GGDEF)-like protein/hemerythrin-like metal-binding protein
MENQVYQLAFYDALTSLPNRRLLDERLLQAMAGSRRSGRYGALMFLDLDNFKPLNDKHGHVAGDLLLVEAAHRLKNAVREIDTVARFGGDEFVVMLSELETDKSASILQTRLIAEKIRDSLSLHFVLDAKGEAGSVQLIEHQCTASIGAIVFNHADKVEYLLKTADKAMYEAKENGRNRIVVSSFEISEEGKEVSSCKNELIMRLNWHESYACGDDIIDSDHRKLFELANVLIESAFAREEFPHQFEADLEQLLAHIVQHFANEEMVLALHHYEDLEAHKSAHRQLIKNALQLRDMVYKGGVTTGELLIFLVDEVVSHHMLKKDREFYPDSDPV